MLLSVIVFLGVFASFRPGGRTVEYVDAAISTVPGIGSVYQSLRRMGDVALESGLENFRSVKLVGFPQADHHSLAFETNRAPDSVEGSLDEDDVVTLFVPLAPNPVMGGFLVHVARDRILDVDMTVEEAARALVTSEVAAGDADTETPSVNPVQRMKRLENVDDILEEDALNRFRFDGREDDEGSRN